MCMCEREGRRCEKVVRGRQAEIERNIDMKIEKERLLISSRADFERQTRERITELYKNVLDFTN